MYRITDACINCGNCQANCPLDAIHQGAAHREINQDSCVECGTCYENCPVGAVKQE